MELTTRPTAIIVTFPVQFLIDLARSYNPGLTKKKAQILWGYAECVEQINFTNSDPEDYWSHIMGNVPVKELRDCISHCYINILSKIRYRAKVICFECGNKGELITKKFGDGRKMSGKNWILLHQFEKLKRAIPMGGFQGFRYWKDDYGE